MSTRSVAAPVRPFSTNPEGEEVAVEKEEQPEIQVSDQEKRTFQAETKRLLDIVAKSIYTDKEVFVRELLSNCSDALEKQRFNEMTGASRSSGEDSLRIDVSTSDKERTFTLFDSGVGMSKQEAVDNLGTIAKSGSKEFLDQLEGANSDADTLGSIIGQFGVGFYSSFIVADKVTVHTKQEGQKGVEWVSDGSGEFVVSDAENLDFERGTRITLKLRPDAREFSQEVEIDKIINKFSQFISYPIRLNGQQINSLQAIWYRDKRDVTDDEYERFFEQLANTKVPFKYKLHYSTDVPLAVKALLYVPSSHGERMGMPQEAGGLHLYSRKVLIKQDCSELVPGYLRFFKGVVDCEDLPLNISRETYQDSSLIAKLRNLITRRALKMLEDELKRDPAKYDKWYGQFNAFLKEGSQTDPENKDQLFRLLRFSANFTERSTDLISLDDYVARMKEGQKKIYFASGASHDAALATPFYEAVKDLALPTLVLTNQLDEFCLTSAGEYKGMPIVNIEQAQIDEIRKELGLAAEDDTVKSRLPEDEVTNFCLWLKDTLSARVAKVKLSNRLKETPALVSGQMSSSMYMMMQMLQQSGQLPGGQGPEPPRELTLEINAAHPTIINLNTLRKAEPEFAKEISLVLLDQLMTANNLPYDAKESHGRNQRFMEQYLAASLEGKQQASRKVVSDAEFEPIEFPTESDGADESILQQAHRDVRSKGSSRTDKKIIKEHRVTGREGRRRK